MAMGTAVGDPGASLRAGCSHRPRRYGPASSGGPNGSASESASADSQAAMRNSSAVANLASGCFCRHREIAARILGDAAHGYSVVGHGRGSCVRWHVAHSHGVLASKGLRPSNIS